MTAGAELTFTKTYAAQLVGLGKPLWLLRKPQKPQQPTTLAALALGRNGSSAGGTPTPGYGRKPEFAHSGCDDGDGVGEPLCDTDELRVADRVVDAARLGEMDELGETDIENDGGALMGLTMKIDVVVSMYFRLEKKVEFTT